ncbi:RNA polymerase sigma-70 factor [Prolixibacteraceae bacterium JC049]|nr:RNA polymerase sigma-70 factor [Prolixibacteraceae bacterium JC049]
MRTNQNILSFNTIYKEHYAGSFRFVKSYVHCDAGAEDIVSESLIKLWNKIKEQNTLELKPLLFTILRNATIDYLRHEMVIKKSLKAYQEKQSQELNFRISLLEAYDPIELFSSEIQEIYQETLEKLPAKTRRVFELSRLEGKTYKEIAKHLNISTKGVDYHIGIALKNFKISLKDYLPVIFFL